MTVRILKGDCRTVLRDLPDESVHCVVTSPPYFGLRDYGVVGQMGLEPTPQAFVDELVDVFGDVRRVLRADGTVWLVIGDTYAGGGGSYEAERNWRAGNPSDIKGQRRTTSRGQSNRDGLGRVTGAKPKDLLGIPWRVAFALQADGWWLRQDIIWSKPNPMPESVTDRCTKAHEYLFLLSKSERYSYDAAAIAEASQTNDVKPGKSGAYMDGNIHGVDREAYPGAQTAKGRLNQWTDGVTRNRRSVWEIATHPYAEAHFATFPPALIEPCILAGCPKGGTVLDPFGGAGTTGLVADRLGRNAILIELNPEYAAMAERRIMGDAPLFSEVNTA